MAEYRPFATGKYGGKPNAAHSHALVADRVDTTMDAMQLPQPEPGLDRPVTYAKRRQLTSGNDSVLAFCEGRQIAFASLAPETRLHTVSI